MANSLTYYGQAVMLRKDATAYRTSGSETNVGGFAKLALRLRLYTSASTPAKTAGSFVEASGGSYAAKTIAESDWVLSTVSSNVQLQLNDQTWTASGGSIANIAGAYVTDTDGNVMGWWERASALTLADGDSITADDLVIRPT
jgi:hypothetical protein